jgi:D-sedoheptulose 7-phosphate isomerase
MTGRLALLVEERERVLGSFLAAEAGGIALCCHALARAFARGGTLIAHGTGAAATDAAHVAVEFMHPVIVGKRALPALALANDPTGSSTLAAVARPGDVAFALSHEPGDPEPAAFLAEARRHGLETVAFVAAGTEAPADHSFAVPSPDPAIVQEVQETAYHVLWELVHVFFEHPGLLADACITCGDVAVEAQVVEVRGRTAVVERQGAREEVAIDLVDRVEAGDRVLCHAGVVLERLA